MPDPSPAIRQTQKRYWRANVTIMILLLGLWAFVGLGCGILWADWLNQWNLGGVPLGFWFAQQGSIATFVVIILVYAITMNRLDAQYHQQVKAGAAPGSKPGNISVTAHPDAKPQAADSDSVFHHDKNGGDA